MQMSNGQALRPLAVGQWPLAENVKPLCVMHRMLEVPGAEHADMHAYAENTETWTPCLLETTMLILVAVRPHVYAPSDKSRN